jgi:hypothetical protein
MTSKSWRKNHFPAKCPSFLRNTIYNIGGKKLVPYRLAALPEGGCVIFRRAMLFYNQTIAKQDRNTYFYELLWILRVIQIFLKNICCVKNVLQRNGIYNLAGRTVS